MPIPAYKPGKSAPCGDSPNRTRCSIPPNPAQPVPTGMAPQSHPPPPDCPLMICRFSAPGLDSSRTDWRFTPPATSSRAPCFSAGSGAPCPIQPHVPPLIDWAYASLLQEPKHRLTWRLHPTRAAERTFFFLFRSISNQFSACHRRRDLNRFLAKSPPLSTFLLRDPLTHHLLSGGSMDDLR